MRQIYRQVLRARIDWAPDEPSFHLFSVDIIEAAYVRFGDEPIAWHWDEHWGFRALEHPAVTPGS